MCFFSWTGLIIFVNSLIFGIFSWLQGRQKLHRVWATFNFAVALWGFGSYKFSTASQPETSLFWLHVAHLGVVSIPVFFLHFVNTFLDLKDKLFVRIAYLIGTIFFVSNITDWLGISKLFIVHVRYVFDSFYVDSPPGLLYGPFVAFFMFVVVYAHVKSFLKLKDASYLKALQIRYFLTATALGFGGGGTAFLMVFGIDYYPYPHVLIAFYPLIMTYAIFRYRLMDLRVAVKVPLIP